MRTSTCLVAPLLLLAGVAAGCSGAASPASFGRGQPDRRVGIRRRHQRERRHRRFGWHNHGRKRRDDSSRGWHNDRTSGSTAAAGGSTAAAGGATIQMGGTAAAGSTAATGGTTSGQAGSTSAAGGSAPATGGSTKLATGGDGRGWNHAGWGLPTTMGGSTSTGGTSATGGASAKGGTASAGGSTMGGTTAKGGNDLRGRLDGRGRHRLDQREHWAHGDRGRGVHATRNQTGLGQPQGSTITISGTKSVTDYDGGGALHEGTLNDCNHGDQSSTKPIIEVADGGSVKNVIFGKNIGDGIHCLGSCTIDNVWYPYICDDAITINKDGTASKASTISNSGFKGARDKSHPTQRRR